MCVLDSWNNTKAWKNDRDWSLWSCVYFHKNFWTWNNNPEANELINMFFKQSGLVVVVVQLLCLLQLFVTPWAIAHQASLSLSPSLGVSPSSCPLNWWCHPTSHPLLSSYPFALNLSQPRGLFQWVGSRLKYWSFSFSISPSSECSGLISFRIDWFDLLAVQGTL